MNDWISSYIDAQRRTLESIPVDGVARCIPILQRALREDRHVFSIGNGGSAANCSHFSTDLGKCSSDAVGKPFRALSLTDNTAWITALGNDYAYEDVFLRQLKNFGRSGDVLVGVSVSGNSPNLVKAFEWAVANGLETIAIVGGKRGRLAEIAKEVLVIEDTHYGRVEDAQMHILHMLCYAFVERPELGAA